ncbi:peptidylprolyl isomerase [Chryseolinea sp. H1M3-3]|uniref:peptidylprolyl isomerase n=1 Tax=Chryseolinea sp. H1M3-3 TaxID=3034144 RepID=UPI0023ECF0C3|nr:peptidylprolyl isomerase [Chryseolinea sp. H1M3-3]
MLKRTAITLICNVLFILCAFAQASTESAKAKSNSLTLFTVNKKPVTVEEFIYLYKKNHQDPGKDFTQEKINEYLALFINFKLKVEEAKRRRLDTTQVFLKEFNGYKDELRKPYLPDSKLVDSLVKMTYERMQEEINASHILISVKPDAAPADTLKAYSKISELRQKILAGESFERVAETSSDDPSAKTNKGNLGYFTAMQMVYPFENAAYTTKVGDVSPPVRTRFGYHILKVSDRRASRGEVEVAHIMLRTGNTKENDKVKDTIFSIYDQLQAGMKWEELCQQFSEDATSKENGGKLRPFGAGAMAAVPEFEKTAFNLEKPGDISDPFQTQYGWHIMRLERKIPVPPFAEITASLKTRVARDERTELSKQDLQNKQRKEYQYQENREVKSRLMNLADSSLQKGKWKPVVTSNFGKEVLFTLKQKKYLVRDFTRYAEKNQRNNALAPTKYLDQLYQQFVDMHIGQLVERELLDTQPEYKYLLQEYYEGILLFDIMEKEVWSKASQDSVGQRSYYEGHKTDYQTTERAKAVFYSSNKNEFRTPLQELIADSSTQKIDEYLLKHKIKAESGYFKKDERAVLQKVPWSKGVHSTENNGIYYLAWLKDILPPGVMSFEEARPSVISDYQSFLEKNWISQLKKKYSVKVNDKGKQYILQQLQTKG